MIHCAHPRHSESLLEAVLSRTSRIQELRVNSLGRGPAKLEEPTELDAGDPVELGSDFARWKRRFRTLNIIGGCGGTDDRGVAEIASACHLLSERR